MSTSVDFASLLGIGTERDQANEEVVPKKAELNVILNHINNILGEANSAHVCFSKLPQSSMLNICMGATRTGWQTWPQSTLFPTLSLETINKVFLPCYSIKRTPASQGRNSSAGSLHLVLCSAVVQKEHKI